jgi:hypothetical protein
MFTEKSTAFVLSNNKISKKYYVNTVSIKKCVVTHLNTCVPTKLEKRKNSDSM